tara:strand:- start:1666 stop:1881 length:216 start_codon:yes stop_codon:yes gene_type:complete
MTETMTPRGGKRAGAGRPPRSGKGGERLAQVKRVWLLKQDAQSIEGEAVRRGVSVSELLREIVVGWLKGRG